MKRQALAVVAGIFSMLLGCGGGGGSASEDNGSGVGGGASGGNMTSVNVSASLGLIRNADVRILDLTQTQISESIAEIGVSGTVALEIPSDHTGAIIVEILGDADAEYFDEAKGAFLSFPSGSKVRAIVSSPQQDIGVTTLTEIATSMVEASDFMLATTNSIDTTNTTIRDLFLEGIESIAMPPTVIGTTGNVLTDSSADLYALFLAILAEMVSSEASPALQIMEQLASDLRDGVLDTALNGTPLLNPILTYASTAEFNTAFGNAIDAAVAAYGDGVTSEDLNELRGVSPFGELSERVENNLLNGQEGVAATVNGTIFTLTQTVSLDLVSSSAVIFAGFNNGLPFDNPSAINENWVFTAPATVGTHDCAPLNQGAGSAVLSSTRGGIVSTGSTRGPDGGVQRTDVCEIVVDEVTATSISGAFRAILIEGSALDGYTVFGTVADGEFRATTTP